MADIERNKQLAFRFIEALNSGDTGIIDEIFAADFVNRNAAPGAPNDREAQKGYMRRVHAAFSDLVCTIDHIVAEGDLVSFYATLRATHSGSLMGEPPTGKPVESLSLTLMRVRDGQVAERWYMANHLDLLRQIGALPAPA